MKKKIYLAPSTFIVTIVGGRHLLNNSISLGGSGQKVDNTEDIGFVKENTMQQRGYNIWDDDWQ